MTEMKNLSIGLFDSGIGGLSLLPHIVKEIPNALCFYIADDFYAPYGEKSPQFVIDRSLFLVKALLSKKVDLVVVACNTATAIAINHLREKFPHTVFIGVEPYINILSKEKFSNESKIGVLSTTLTSKSERFLKLKKEKDPQNRIHSYSSTNLAMLVEEIFKLKNINGNMRTMIEAEISFLKEEKLDYLILGCTHYSLIKKTLEDILALTTISPCENVAKRVCELAKAQIGPFLSDLHREFYFIQSSKNLELQGNNFPKCLNFDKLDVGQIPFL